MTTLCRRRVLTAVAVAVCSAVLAACGGSGLSAASSKAAKQTSTTNLAALVRTARSEGTLTIYTAVQADQMKGWTEAFTKKYGVKVKILRLSSATLGTTFQTQQQAGRNKADLLETSNLSQLQDFQKQKWLAEYTPQAANLYPSDRVVAGYMYPLYQSNGGIAWNTKVTPAAVQQELATDPWNALLDPALKGKIVLISPSNGGSGMAYYANLVYNLGNQYGWPYLQKLADQKPAITDSIASISQQVSAGTYYATNFGEESIFGPLAVQGAPVRFSALSRMNATQFMQAIPKAAPHPAAARLWSEWSATVAGQEAMTKSAGGESSAKGWTENASYANESWYKPVAQPWLDWRTDPRLQGDELQAFLAKWNSVFGVSS
ncbi:iron(III) transport system substrate-binding protein [Actinacidiphila yanglinensis]|uniref:Iron(III) transport system substrate-binding protein n=1 Tax=Actinacidiphila yanglinensis TaxID=310779 RepID=A0A1H6CHS6_9ACTN|nr:extracellular solute-binding protein [Actinacidiphila yanglinensis]SEG72509.1 iron(III) transport system substrate-binding protein [Actinacidiphila yanglinensis]